MPSLNWIGRDAVINHHFDVPFHFLERKYGAGENMIIHGDNLLVLKNLLPKFERKIKVIYIDPPYNTGNENWIYNDAVNDPQIKKWLGAVVGREGEDFTRHDKWLCMMYPRLRLMQMLLAEDGAIFISTNFRDTYHYLRMICDEIFGSTNYVGTLTWESTTQPINSGKAKFGLQTRTEPILFYKGRRAENIFKLTAIESKRSYPHRGRFGRCRFEIIEKSDAGDYRRPTMKFKILGRLPREGKRWQIGEETARRLEREGKVELVDGIVKRAVYPEDEADRIAYAPFWSHLTDVGTAQTGKELLNSIMGEAVGFDTVKPVKLIEALLSHFDEDAIVLDAFAGSGTTAHAVIDLNRADGGSRRFILIESQPYAETIAAERVRRVDPDCPFQFLELGERLFLDDERLNPNVDLDRLREYVWLTETRQPLPTIDRSDQKYLLGIDNDRAIYFLFDRERTLTLDHHFVFSTLRDGASERVFYAERTLLSEQFFRKYRAEFRRIPSGLIRV